jgi:hypothetical protein
MLGTSFPLSFIYETADKTWRYITVLITHARQMQSVDYLMNN